MTSVLPAPAAERIRVLAVDDSVVVRRLIAHVVDAEADMELAGFAADGRAGLDKVERLRPDVVVLDLEMPVLGGLDTLAELRRRHPDLPVVLFSHVAAADAGAGLDALSRGATSFVLKPSSADGIGLGEPYLRDELVPVIRGLARGAQLRAFGPVLRSAAPADADPRGSARPEVLVVGASTGGPDALATVLAGLPFDLAVPVLIVQHMPPAFTASLARRLDRVSPLDVAEAVQGERLRPGRAYVAEGGRHLEVGGTAAAAVVRLGDGPKENSCRPSVDVLFRSAAQVYGPAVLALVLTGMGHDGERGARAVHAAGGRLLAQSPESSVVPSMPGHVAPIADAVLDLADVAGELAVRLPRGEAR